MGKAPASTFLISSILLLALILGGFNPFTSNEVVEPESPLFEYATPESQNVDPGDLSALTEAVTGFFEEDKVVGAEMVVIKNHKIILHETFGWKDREKNEPVARNTIFNIRSMTKPVTGAAIQLLIDQGRLSLDDYVYSYVPGFDNERSRNITVKQLLNHMSGLPLSILVSTQDFESLDALANQIGEVGPEFPPGSKFWYSDSGTEVLGEIIQVVSGMPLGDYVTENVLNPLEMNGSFYYIPSAINDSRRQRIASLYLGVEGGWVKAWSFEEPLYPFALGSQSLYSTPLDYARFLNIFMEDGRNGREQFLSEEAVSRVLTPETRMKLLGSDVYYPTGFWNLEVYYGQLMTVYQSMVESKPSNVVFGHSGSDGTYSWAWPDQGLIVLYFTQSRGSPSGLKLEAIIDEYLVHHELKEVNADARRKYQAYLGAYTADFGVFQNAEFNVVVQNGHLAVDIPDQFVFELEEPDAEGWWYFKMFDDVAVSFEYTAKGNVTGMKLHQYGYAFDIPKKPAQVQGYPEDIGKYAGLYLTEDPNVIIEVLVENGRLYLDVPGQPVKLELNPPDSQGFWRVKLNPVVAISFQETDYGEVTSFTMYLPDGTYILYPRLSEG